MPEKPLRRSDSQLHPALQFLIFAVLFIGVLVAGTVIGIAIILLLYGSKGVGAMTQLTAGSPHFSTMLWILQIAGTTIPILAAPVIYAFAISKDPKDYLKPTFSFHWGLLALVLAIMFISNPVIEFLSDLNQKMVLPKFLQWMRDSEDKAEKLMNVFLQMDSVWGLMINVIFIGLVTAIVEEFMFRGVLQTIFVRWTKSVHAAVWITAILFSAFHMEFFGFLPRMALGVLFGYFVAWSGSIWPAVWAHFLNNGTAIVATYLYQHKILKGNPDDLHLGNTYIYIFSFVILITLMLIYRRIALEKKPIPAYDGEKLD